MANRVVANLFRFRRAARSEVLAVALEGTHDIEGTTD